MAGITSYGVYVPRYRLDRRLIFRAMGWFNPSTASAARGTKAVANYDEDSLTMAWAAAWPLVDGEAPGAMYLASTTLPYSERQNSAIVAAALDLPDDTRTMDVTGSTAAGIEALAAALREPGPVLVTSSDVRLGKPGGKAEHLFGDAAAAFMVGDDGVQARLLGMTSLHRDFVDKRRPAGEPFAHGWEERWVRDEGYVKLVLAGLTDCLGRCGVEPAEVDRWVVAVPDVRAAKAMSRRLGVPVERFQDNLVRTIGDTGAALGPMMLAAALEQAGPGEKILVAGYGSGVDVLLFETTDLISRGPSGPGLQERLEATVPLEPYERYTVFRGLVPLDVGIRGESVAPTAFSVLWRDREAMLSLHGNRCKRCGTPQFPPQRICVNPGCGAIDEHEPYPFARRAGKIFTYTADMLAFTYDPPALYGLVDFEGGGRLFLDFTDCTPDDLAVGAQVEMVFRRKYLDEARGVHGYFWKAKPVRSLGHDRKE